MMNIITVIIDDVEYNLKGNEDEEYLNRVAFFVDKKIRNIKSKNEKLSISSAAVLTAINIADDMFKSQEIYSELLNRYRDLEEQQNSLKNENSNLKAYGEETEYKNQQLKLEIEDLMNTEDRCKVDEVNRELEVVKIELQALKEKSEKEIKALQEKNLELENERDLLEKRLVEEKVAVEKNLIQEKEREKSKLTNIYENKIEELKTQYENKIVSIKSENEEVIGMLKDEETQNLSKVLEEKGKELKLIDDIHREQINKLKQEHKEKFNSINEDHENKISEIKHRFNESQHKTQEAYLKELKELKDKIAKLNSIHSSELKSLEESHIRDIEVLKGKFNKERVSLEEIKAKDIESVKSEYVSKEQQAKNIALKEIEDIKRSYDIEKEQLNSSFNKQLEELSTKLQYVEGEAKKYKTLYNYNKEQGETSKLQLQNYKFKVLELENKINEQSIALAKEKKLRLAVSKK